MAMDLLKFIYREAEGSKLKMTTASFMSGMSRGMLLATINATAANTFSRNTDHFYILYFILYLFLYITSSYYVKVNSSILIEKAKHRLTMRLADKLMLAELGFIESYNKSELYQKIRMDVNVVCNVANTLLNSSQAAILLFFCLVYIAWLVPIALFFTLIGIIIGVATYLIQHRKIIEKIKLARSTAVEFTERLRDLISGFKELKVNTGKRNDFQEHMVTVSNKHRSLNVEVTKLETISFLTTQIFIFTLIAVVIFILPQIYPINETITFQFFASILFLIGPLETLISSYQNIAKANISLENILKLETDIDDSAPEYTGTGKLINSEFNDVRLENIFFNYQKNNTDDKFTIGPINMKIKRGEILFIVGGNGTGKTTLLKLITGLYTPSSGQILINGEKLTSDNNQNYRELFTTIFTDFHIFKKLYGIGTLDEKKLHTILDKLKLTDKTSIKDGRFTSTNLSRGQMKRLAYLITCFDNREIYIFDEFAADQDPNFKKYFYYTILPELKNDGKTVIAVTHDDNYYDACDRLIKMDNGKIVSEPLKSVLANQYDIENQA